MLWSLRGFLMISLFFSTYPATSQRILRISLSRIFEFLKSRFLENRAISNFSFRVRDSGTRLYCDPKTVNHTRLTGWYNKFKQHKTLTKKIEEELMPLTWHTKRRWDWCFSENEKKEIEPIFTEKADKC